jgi:hypothetical protein
VIYFYKKGLLYGGITCGIYIIFPIVLISVLSNLNMLQFNSSFTFIILTFGTIAVIISFFKNIFPPNSYHHNLIGLGTAIYSGIYLFYIFGGFSTGANFGNYYIKTEELDALLGLQILAWLMLLAALINAIYYTLKCLEVRRHKEFLLSLKSHFKIRHLFRGASLILYLILLFFILSVILNALYLSFQIQEQYNYSWNNNGTPLNLLDDRIRLTAYFNAVNPGWYSIQDIILNVEIYTVNTSDLFQLALPDNTKIGEIQNVHYTEFPGASTLYNVSLPIDIIPSFVPGLLTNNASLSLRISLLCSYAGITLILNTTAFTSWSQII